MHIDNGDDWGDQELYRLLKKNVIAPQIVLSGHMHHPKSTFDNIHNSKICNCGSNKDAHHPNHVVLDIEAKMQEFKLFATC